MNITDSQNRWRVTSGRVENMKTHNSRIVIGMPTHHALAMMHEREFVEGCETAFETGAWPE